MSADDRPLLEIRDLRVSFATERGEARAVDGVTLEISPGETLGLVGESGCGKSLTALSILRLVPEPPGRTLPGSSILYRGQELVGAGASRLRAVRGAEIGMVFQEPMTSLNPVYRLGDQVGEALRTHTRATRAEVRAEVTELLGRVGLPEPERARRAYPHELSGGMRQRVMIAMAIACRPSLLVADEPTTALDVTVQAQILELIDSLRRELGMAVLLISHDLAVVSRVADRVAVMYAGRIVEQAPADAFFAAPAHPYAEGLLRAVPSVEARTELAVIPGRVPDPTAWPRACRFHPRCPYAWDRCRADEPPLAAAGAAGGGPRAAGTHRVRCWLAEEPGRRAAPGFAQVGA